MTAFFQRLANEGIDKTNTLFPVTVDEGDHFAGGAPTNPGCDGVNTACTYGNNVGETDVNLNGLVKGNTGDTTPWSHSAAVTASSAGDKASCAAGSRCTTALACTAGIC